MVILTAVFFIPVNVPASLFASFLCAAFLPSRYARIYMVSSMMTPRYLYSFTTGMPWKLSVLICGVFLSFLATKMADFPWLIYMP